MFGGFTGAATLSDTWQFNNGSWGMQPGGGPPARWGHVISAFNGGIVVFGGLQLPGTALSDTWVHTFSNWQQVPPNGAVTLIDAGNVVISRTKDDQAYIGTSAPQAFVELTSHTSEGSWQTNTRDGTLVKVRVSLDAGTSSNRTAVQRNLYEVGLVLEVSVGARITPELIGSEGIERLSSDMLTRVNAYLDAKGIGRLNSVAIQDLWYTRP